MNNQLVALFFGVGIGGIVYYQANKRLSGNSKAIWIVTIAAAAVAYFIFYTLFAWVIDGGSGGTGSY